MSEGVAQLSVRALREYLLATLPAKVATINGERAAVVRSALAGPFTLPSGAALFLGTSRDGAPTRVDLTAGSRTAAQVAAEIEAEGVAGITASADTDGRLVLTGAAPVAGTPSCVAVLPDSDTATNAVFGWAVGGEHVVRAAIEAPTWRGVVDGDWTLAKDLDGGGFWVGIGNRDVRPYPSPTNVRRDEYAVSLTLDIIRRFGANQTTHRDREAIGACVRAVDEALRTTAGRQLGRAASGDIMLVDVVNTRIASSSFDTRQGFLFDVAQVTLNVRVFQRAS